MTQKTQVKKLYHKVHNENTQSTQKAENQS